MAWFRCDEGNYGLQSRLKGFLNIIYYRMFLLSLKGLKRAVINYVWQLNEFSVVWMLWIVILFHLIFNDACKKSCKEIYKKKQASYIKPQYVSSWIQYLHFIINVCCLINQMLVDTITLV